MSLTIWTIAGFTGIAGLIWTLLERIQQKEQTSFWESFVLFIKNWVAMFFIFSAVVKLVDPVGFKIKIQDYFSEFNLNGLKPYAQFISFVVLVAEFVLGVMLLFNIWKRITIALLLAMILFFTLLTGVSAIFDVVKDCGCFGDFLKISPWTSFIKDLVLLAMILFILLNLKKITPWWKAKYSLFITFASILAALAFTLHNYYHLPIWDFRAYKIGTYIPEAMEEIEPPVYENRLTYKHKNTGEEKVFVNTFPENLDDWEYLDREYKLVDEGIPAPIHDFSLNTYDGDDLTGTILDYEKPILLITVLKTATAKGKGIDKIKALIDYSNETNAFGYAFLSAETEADLAEYKKKYDLEGQNLSIDRTTLKTMIRSNPGVILLTQGTIAGKWHYRDIPKPENLLP